MISRCLAMAEYTVDCFALFIWWSVSKACSLIRLFDRQSKLVFVLNWELSVYCVSGDECKLSSHQVLSYLMNCSHNPSKMTVVYHHYLQSIPIFKCLSPSTLLFWVISVVPPVIAIILTYLMWILFPQMATLFPLLSFLVDH